MKKFKKPLQVAITKTIIHVLALFSLKTCQRVGTAIGWISLITPNRNRSVTRKNIQLCYPEMSAEQQNRLVKDSLIETGKTFAEAGPMWKWNKDKLFSYIKNVQGEELLKKAHENRVLQLELALAEIIRDNSREVQVVSTRSR